MEIVPSVHMIRHSFTVPVADGVDLERFVNSYLIYGETITLIDTGVAGSETGIFTSIRSTGRDPSEIRWIILTHSHPDHIGAARVIQRETGCMISAHPAERAWIENVDCQNRERPVPGFTSLVSGSVKIDRELSDGVLIVPDMNGDLNMRVLHTPGHSPGSVSLFMENKGVLFSGDAVPVTGDLPVYDDAVASVRSLQRLRGLAGIRVHLPAWDNPGEGSAAYMQIDHALRYLQQIHEAVLACDGSDPSDLMELTRKTAVSLGLPPQAINPLLSRTFAANLRVRDRKNLFMDSS